MPMPEQKAVLWDMDGVLADSSALHFQTWEDVLIKQGIPFDRDKFRAIYGLKNSDLLPHLAGKPMEPALVRQLADEKELAFRQVLPGLLKPFPGVVDWLQRFHTMGWKQAVASSAPPENVLAVVQELGIGNYFDAFVTPGDLPGKPDPAVFLLAAQRLAVLPGKCIVIEDSVAGVQAAVRARMRCIAVTNTNPPEALAQADIVISGLNLLTQDQVTSLV